VGRFRGVFFCGVWGGRFGFFVRVVIGGGWWRGWVFWGWGCGCFLLRG